MKTEDENAPTCTPYLPDDFVFDMGAEPCQAVGMKNEGVNAPDGTTYPIRTLKDIFALPSYEHMERCLSETAKVLLHARSTVDMLEGVAASMGIKHDGPVADFPEVLNWIDDGKGELGADFKTPDGDVILSTRIAQANTANTTAPHVQP